MNATALWALLAVLGLGTFLIRLSFIELIDRIRMPDWLRRALRYVPPAVLAALVLPAVIHGGGGLSPDNPRLLAAAAASLVAVSLRSVLATLGVGMGTLWLLTWMGVGSP